MTRIQYTGSNYDELKDILGDRLLAPYFCMGLTMLSILTDDGPITVNEADYIVIGENGEISKCRILPSPSRMTSSFSVTARRM